MSLPPNYRKDTISSLQKQVKRKSFATTSLHTFSAPPSRQANYPPGDDTSFEHSFERSFSRSVSRSLNRSFDHSFDRSLNLSPEPMGDSILDPSPPPAASGPDPGKNGERKEIPGSTRVDANSPVPVVESEVKDEKSREEEEAAKVKKVAEEKKAEDEKKAGDEKTAADEKKAADEKAADDKKAADSKKDEQAARNQASSETSNTPAVDNLTPVPAGNGAVPGSQTNKDGEKVGEAAVNANQGILDPGKASAEVAALLPKVPKLEVSMPPLPELPGLPIIQKVNGPEKLESPKTPVDRINAIWNKWLNMYVSDSQYVEAAVNHYDTNYREVPDLVISTHGSDFKATWSIIYQGYPGADNNNTNTGPMDWKPIEKHMKHLCTRRNSGETPIFAIAAFGRWVRLYAFGADVLTPFNFTLITPLAPPLILVVPNEVPNDTQANTYTSLDVGNDLHVLFIMFYLNVAIRTGGAFPEKPKSDTAPASNAGPTTKTD